MNPSLSPNLASRHTVVLSLVTLYVHVEGVGRVGVGVVGGREVVKVELVTGASVVT